MAGESAALEAGDDVAGRVMDGRQSATSAEKGAPRKLIEMSSSMEAASPRAETRVETKTAGRKREVRATQIMGLGAAVVAEPRGLSLRRGRHSLPRGRAKSRPSRWA